MPEYKTLKIEERADGIAIITLNRPERLNAINFELVEELRACLDYLDTNLNLRVLILFGEGRAFSSGLDLREIGVVDQRKVPEDFQRFAYLNTKDKIKRIMIFQEMLTSLFIKLRHIPQPVIAAVKGPAYGGGFALTLASDIRIAGESAVFCNAFINIGVSGADCGSTYFLPRLVGVSRASEILFTGKNVDAKEADRIGLVSKVVPDANLLDVALAIAQELLTKSPLGLRFTKEAINANIDAQSLESAIKLENRIQNMCTGTRDAFEGMTARLEKRKPEYDKW